jgi:outer membrane protein TolC
MFSKIVLLISLWFVSSFAQEALTLQKAIESALQYNNDMKAAVKEGQAVESQIKQAGRFQNPEIEVETENLGSSVTSVVLTQPVELGGKRKRKKSAAYCFGGI